MQKKDTRPAGEDGLEGARAAEEVEKLRLITDSIQVLVAYVDADHRYRFNNQVYEEWFGQSPSDLQGRHVKEVLGEEAYASLLPYFERVLSGKRVVFESRVPYRDGGERHIQATYSPHWSEGKVKGFFSVVQDVTAQRQAEKTLRESETQYRALFETTLDGIMVVDDSGRYIDLNESMCQILRAPRSRLIGRHFSDFVLPETLEAAKQAFSDLKSKGFYRGAFPMRAADGARVDLEWSSRGDFLPGLHFCVARDVSERNRAEGERRERETLLDIALDAGRMGVFEFDIRSGKVAWSPHLERIHGLAPGTFGGTFEDFKRDIHPDDLNRVLNRVQQTIQEKKTDYGVEYRIIKPNGETAWVEARGRVFYDPNGGAERFVGLCMDVTARKGAEETLQNEFAFRRAIEDAIPAGITMVDPNGRKTYVNRAFCDMVGWSESELVGAAPPYLYWPPEESDRISQAFEATMAGKVPPGGFELRFRRRNEARFDVLLTPVPVRDSHGALTGWLASVVDITGRKGIEQKLQESETQYRLLFETNPQPMWVYEIESMAFL